MRQQKAMQRAGVEAVKGLSYHNHYKEFVAAARFTDCPEANEFLKAPARGAFSMRDFA